MVTERVQLELLHTIRYGLYIFAAVRFVENMPPLASVFFFGALGYAAIREKDVRLALGRGFTKIGTPELPPPSGATDK